MHTRALWVIGATAGLLISQAAARAEGDKDQPLTPAQSVTLAEKLADSMVRVEYTLQVDKGESPSGSAYDLYDDALETYIREERPLEMPGFLVAPDRVLSPDAGVHPRFIKSIQVRCGDKAIAAEPAAYLKARPAVVFKLAQPAAGRTPLQFDPKAKGPYLAASYQLDDGEWSVSLAPFSLGEVTVSAAGRKYSTAAAPCVIVDKAGTPVACSMGNELPTDDSWKGSPLDRPMYSADEWAAVTAAVTGRTDACVLKVKLNFRSPKKNESPYYRGGDDDETATERNVLGLLVGPTRVAVLANLAAKTTARLERITVYRNDSDQTVAGKFAGTLKDYGVLVADLDKPLPGPVEPAAGRIDAWRDTLLVGAEVRVQGEQRVAYYLRRLIGTFSLGWKGRLYPGGRYGGAAEVFLFSADGRLAALPVCRREKVAVRERWSSESTVMTPAGYLAEALANVAGNVDPSNVPLTEEEENRLAWMGVEMQPLDPDLARVNNVSDITSNGETGAMVSYVYPNSPAAKAGVQVGWILVRLNVEDQPKPIEVTLERFEPYLESFPWDRLDEVPEQYFDQIPKPWPGVENSFTRALTDLGFGKKYQAEFFCDGKIVKKPFVIEQSPPHYDSAPRYTAKELGLTVRDLTYEVRRHFQKGPNDPGVIISKIEPGSKASVGGLKPYEIITHANDKEVKNVKDFENLVSATKGELRLSVKRMARGRIVKIDMAAAQNKPASQPIDKDDADNDESE